MRTKINPDSFGFLISDIGRLSRGVFELIARPADPNDRRAKIASLTPRANDILSQIAQAGARVETIISEGLTPEQWQTFRATALTLRQNLSASRGATCKSEAAE